MVMVTLLLAFRLSTLFLLLAAVAVSAVDPDGAAAPDTEAAALLRLKASLFDPTNALEAWSPSSPSPPCDETHRWPRVQCYNGVLIGLRLARLNLSGDFDFAALSRLPGLHSVNLIRNNFSGPLPASLATVRSLRALYLSRNAFTGPVPRDVFAAMSWLKKLYLDRNDFSGVLPADAIAGAPRLQELHLDHNRIEGHVPSKLPATLRLFNVSHNRLTGVLPEAVAARFNESAFAGNPGLCGAPGSNPGACAAASPGPVHSAMPPMSAADYFAVQEETSVFVVMGIIMLVVLLVTGAMVLMLRQDEGISTATSGYEHPGAGAPAGAFTVPHAAGAGAVSAAMVTMEQGGGTGGVGGVGGAGGRNKVAEFVLMSHAAGEFGLPELMKASAEVLGNGTLGSAYKAAMRNGVTVAVKRMRDMNRVGRVEFEEHIQMLGELRHPNVLAPVGYHYRKEEKLIVSEFMPRGSLLYVLHGDQSPQRVVLDWPARMRIAVGVARGMAYLHEKLGIPAMRLVSMDGADFDAPPPPPPHGNLKSGNILLDAHLEPRIVDYGFFPLVNTSQAPQAMFAFRSPEASTSAAGAGGNSCPSPAPAAPPANAPPCRRGPTCTASGSCSSSSSRGSSRRSISSRRAAAPTLCSGRRRRWPAAPSRRSSTPSSKPAPAPPR
uniref:Protein kinase domain-containing protein n=1 Tax=Oryza punctata TaxID=4537 RepID=A0A0E0MHB3_ORYPU